MEAYWYAVIAVAGVYFGVLLLAWLFSEQLAAAYLWLRKKQRS